MCHFLSNLSFPSETPGYLASIVFYCSTFAIPLVSNCRKPMRSQRSKIDENYFKVEYFYHWACTTICQNLLSLENPWVLGTHSFLLFNLWFPLGLWEANEKPRIKNWWKLFQSWIFLLLSIRHYLSKFTFLSKTAGYLASIVFYCSTFGFPLASHCRKSTGSQTLKIDKNYFKVEYLYKWGCTTFCKKISCPSKTLGCLACFLLFNLWLPHGFPL